MNRRRDLCYIIIAAVAVAVLATLALIAATAVLAWCFVRAVAADPPTTARPAPRRRNWRRVVAGLVAVALGAMATLDGAAGFVERISASPLVASAAEWVLTHLL